MPAGVLGLDLSHNNPVVSFHDIARFEKFVILKATQGLSFVDPTYYANRARAKSVGLVTGAYHFLDPNADGAAQAERYVATAQLKPGDIIPIVDVEVAGAGLKANLLAFCAKVKELTGHYPAVYSGQAFYEEYLRAILPPETTLWIARYGPHPDIAGITAWQFTSTAQVAGVQGNVDEDRFEGSDPRKYMIT